MGVCFSISFFKDKILGFKCHFMKTIPESPSNMSFLTVNCCTLSVSQLCMEQGSTTHQKNGAHVYACIYLYKYIDTWDTEDHPGCSIVEKAAQQKINTSTLNSRAQGSGHRILIRFFLLQHSQQGNVHTSRRPSGGRPAAC